MQLLDAILHEISSNGFSDSEVSDFWDDFDNLQKAKIVRWISPSSQICWNTKLLRCKMPCGWYFISDGFAVTLHPDTFSHFTNCEARRFLEIGKVELSHSLWLALNDKAALQNYLLQSRSIQVSASLLILWGFSFSTRPHLLIGFILVVSQDLLKLLFILLTFPLMVVIFRHPRKSFQRTAGFTSRIRRVWCFYAMN